MTDRSARSNFRAPGGSLAGGGNGDADGNRAAAAGLITTDAALEALVTRLGMEVGLDTEFIRVRTFYPVAALYQLADDGGTALVDATAPAAFTALKRLLLDATRVKVMHSCSEDLEVMARHLDLRPNAMVDTQLADAFLTTEMSASYAALVERYVGVQLGKQETRSNWLRRPLSASQVAYAQLDVAYLLPVWRAQRRALESTGRLSWFQEEMRQQLTARTPPPESWYRNLKGAGRLSRRELAVLRSVATWREREARRRDLPRSWMVRDDALLAMARRKQLTASDVAEWLPPRAARRYGPALEVAHRRGLDDPDPPPRPPRPLGPRETAIARALRAVIDREGRRLNLAPRLLAAKRDIEAAVRHHRDYGALPERFNGWRGALLGDVLTDALEGAA